MSASSLRVLGPRPLHAGDGQAAAPAAADLGVGAAHTARARRAAPGLRPADRGDVRPRPLAEQDREPPAATPDAYRIGIIRSVLVIVGDVAHCVDELCEFVTRYGLTDVVTWGAAPGLQPAVLTPTIERFAAEVVPAVKARLAG
ncbi:MAG: hypothetical protein QM733_19110 [Ilumatobacteraceae bacterium]